MAQLMLRVRNIEGPDMQVILFQYGIPIRKICTHQARLRASAANVHGGDTVGAPK